jgi:hypothetical protein
VHNALPFIGLRGLLDDGDSYAQTLCEGRIHAGHVADRRSDQQSHQQGEEEHQAQFWWSRS